MAYSNWDIIKKSNGKFAQKIQDAASFHGAERLSEESQRRLRDLYEAGRHIQCCCQKPKALMYIRLLESGLYTLVNHPVKGRHAEQCAFYSDISGEIDDRTWGGNVYDGSEILTFCMHNNITTKEGGTSNTGNPNGIKKLPKKGKPPKLGRLLYQLLSDGWLHWHNPKKKWTQKGCFTAIWSAAKKIRFGQGTLDQYIVHGKDRMKFAENKLFSSTWKGAGRPHVVCLEVFKDISEVTGTSFIGDGIKLDYENVIMPKLKTTKAPVLVFSTLVKGDRPNPQNDNIVKRHTCFIQPIVSENCFMPVDSSYEREFASRSIALCDQIGASDIANEQSPSRKIAFHKPVRPFISYQGDFLLPDFIFKVSDADGNTSKHIVEVKGFDTPEYVKRKERLHPLMEKCFNAQTFCEVDGDNSEQMNTALKSIANYSES